MDLPQGPIPQSEPSYQAKFSWDQGLSWLNFNSFDPILPSESVTDDANPQLRHHSEQPAPLTIPGRQTCTASNTGVNCIDPVSPVSTHELLHRTLSPHLIDVPARTKLKCEFCQRSFDKQDVLK